ncbi:MAG TPA: glycoside hydrolase family 6 protein [Solirubrobacteraceae bacterium]
MSGAFGGARLARRLTALALALSLVAFAAASAASAGGSVRSQAHAAAQSCANPDLTSTLRDPANPLVLPTPPGFDPLHGAHFFVDGPAHGTVAKGIEQLIGDHTQYPDTAEWEDFRQSLLTGPLSQRITSAKMANEVKLLIKIGDQEETNNLSEYSMGGGRGAIYAQTLKINCNNMKSDPPGDPAQTGVPGATVSRAGALDTTNPTVPVFSTFFVYPNGAFCPKYADLYKWIVPPEDGVPGHPSKFKRMINEMAAAQAGRRAVYLLEIDSVGASICIKGATLKLWEYGLRYEIKKMSALPHTVVYQEAGSSDENSPRYVARLLHDICVGQDPITNTGPVINNCLLMRGFWTNATHFNWDSNELPWAQQVSKLLDRLIFASLHTHYHAFHIINTAQNGRGPLHPRNRVTNGNENLCNPPGRGLGRIPTANTMPTFDGHNFDGSWYTRILDAFLWSGTPGRSHNSNCPGGPWAAAGIFDVRFAAELAQNANQQLGPGFPSLPY